MEELQLNNELNLTSKQQIILTKKDMKGEKIKNEAEQWAYKHRLLNSSCSRSGPTNKVTLNKNSKSN